MHFRFIRYTKYWLSLSAIIILIGFGAMVKNNYKNGTALVYGIDFTGGTLMEIRFFDETKKDDQTQLIYDSIATALPDAVKQITVTDKNTYIIQARDLTNEEHDLVVQSILGAAGPLEEIRFTIIGPKISETLKRKAIIAIIIASVAIVFYISFAFWRVPKRVSPWRFGICAIIAMIYNVLATVGFFAFMGYEVDALFITALLTVMGFSVHDTITVFDRIRENLKKQTRDQTFGDIADISLNQTLVRSLNTGLCTLITLVVLWLFGAESLRPFILAMLFGIIIGTYSSIFIASPLLTWWQEKSRMR